MSVFVPLGHNGIGLGAVRAESNYLSVSTLKSIAPSPCYMLFFGSICFCQVANVEKISLGFNTFSTKVFKVALKGLRMILIHRKDW